MTDYTKLIERMRTDSAFDFTTLGNESADAIEALQKEVSTLDVLLEECKMDWSGDVTQLKAEHKHEIEALQAECAEHKENAMRNARIAVSIRAERDQLQSKLGDAIQSSAHWQHQFTEAQAENERLKGYRDRALELATAYNNAQDRIDKLVEEGANNLGLAKERDALQAKLDAMGKGEPVQFLCDATRFKVRQHEGDEAGRIFGLPSELNGRWVALVAADDDCHLKLAAPKALAPLTQPEVVEAFCNTRHNTQYVSVFDAGVRFAEKHHGIGGTP